MYRAKIGDFYIVVGENSQVTFTEGDGATEFESYRDASEQLDALQVHGYELERIHASNVRRDNPDNNTTIID